MIDENHIKIFGRHLIDAAAITQLMTCAEEADHAVLTADAHVGYAHPIGGAIAYKDKISLSGVGFDIACGNKAVQTAVQADELNLPAVMDEIEKNISFGIGRVNRHRVDHPVFEKIDKLSVKTTRSHKTQLFQKARDQLGTVGSGNHFVDLFRDADGWLWIGVHFGSRGFGHNITTGFISIAQGGSFDQRARESGLFSKPILFDLDSETGLDYLECLHVAGQYAYAGRDWVVDKILEILDNPEVTFHVHNHHNFAWKEKHFGSEYMVVRKGCTPAFPGQRGFIGSNMFDDSVIVEGIDGSESRSSLFSTVHGAGRVMSRRQAIGKVKYVNSPSGRKRKVIKAGQVDYAKTRMQAARLGVELRGGGADESPQCYKSLQDVLSCHAASLRILHVLTPIGVVMAGEDVFDPYKD